MPFVKIKKIGAEDIKGYVSLQDWTVIKEIQEKKADFDEFEKVLMSNLQKDGYWDWAQLIRDYPAYLDHILRCVKAANTVYEFSFYSINSYYTSAGLNRPMVEKEMVVPFRDSVLVNVPKWEEVIDGSKIGPWYTVKNINII